MSIGPKNNPLTFVVDLDKRKGPGQNFFVNFSGISAWVLMINIGCVQVAGICTVTDHNSMQAQTIICV